MRRPRRAPRCEPVPEPSAPAIAATTAPTEARRRRRTPAPPANFRPSPRASSPSAPTTRRPAVLHETTPAEPPAGLRQWERRPDRRRRASRARSPTRSPKPLGFATDDVAWVVARSTTRSPRPEGVRLRHQPGLVHRRSGPSRTTCPTATTSSTRRSSSWKDSPVAKVTTVSRPEGRQARRPGRDDEPRAIETSSSRRPRRRSTTPTMPRSRRSRRSRSTACVVDLPTAFFLTTHPDVRHRDRGPARDGRRRRAEHFSLCSTRAAR